MTQFILLVEREVKLCLVWTGIVPIDLIRFMMPSLLMLVSLQSCWGEVDLLPLGISCLIDRQMFPTPLHLS